MKLTANELQECLRRLPEPTDPRYVHHRPEYKLGLPELMRVNDALVEESLVSFRVVTFEVELRGYPGREVPTWVFDTARQGKETR